MRKEFRDLIGPQEFQRLIDGLNCEVSTEKLEIKEARGRICCKDVFSPTDVPPYNRSLMDGYAVVASDTYGADEENPVKLELAGALKIGTHSSARLKSGQALEIATGTEMPTGANAVVMVEETDRRDDEIEVRKPVTPSENVINSGTDIARGDLILREGKKLTPMELAKLAACGLDKVEVYCGARVGIISTGPELVPPGRDLGPSQIYDINASLIHTGVEEAGGRPQFLGTVNDDRGQLNEIFSRGVDTCDCLITSGSTSAGPHDMVYSILEEQGEILAHGVKIKPGKPTVLGKIEDTPVFGLPGNPSSAYVIFMNFVAPLINQTAGLVDESNPARTATMAEKSWSEGGRLEQKFVGLVDRGEKSRAYPINKVSGAITLLSQADGFVEIPEGVNFLEQGEEVTVYLLSREPATPKLLIIGSNCQGLHRLLNFLPFEVRYLSRGSMGGVRAMENSIPDLAGIHIWTPEGYNVPFLRERGIEDIVLLRGYAREQGLMLPSGNPDSIESVEDLLESDPKIVNRTSGSGTRILFDNLLEKAADNIGLDSDQVSRKIDGYEVELSTHSAVAAAVTSGKAEAGIGIRTVAEEAGLDFVKLQDEEFDVLCQKSALTDPHVGEFRGVLSGSEFKEQLEQMPGLSAREEMGEIIFSS